MGGVSTAIERGVSTHAVLGEFRRMQSNGGFRRMRFFYKVSKKNISSSIRRDRFKVIPIHHRYDRSGYDGSRQTVCRESRWRR